MKGDRELKPHFLEMIVEEPMLQEKLVEGTGIGLELIVELAIQQSQLFALDGCAVIIKKYYNASMPKRFCISHRDLFQTDAESNDLFQK